MYIINYLELFRYYKVFLDTSSLMCQGAEIFFKGPVENELINYKNKLIVQYKVSEEINNLTESNKEDVKSKAKTAVNLVNDLYYKKSILTQIGTEEDFSADSQYLKVITENHNKYDFLVLTQDKSLAKNILDFKRTRENKFNKEIRVFMILDGGELKDWEEVIREYKPRTVSTRCHNCKKWFKADKKFIDSLYDKGKSVFCESCKVQIIDNRRYRN